jgi:hypothetical protein
VPIQSSPTSIRTDVGHSGLLLALAVAIAALVVYAATLAPALTFEHHGTDGGDLIAAAKTLGVPHPTGYPTYTLLARLFMLIPLGTLAFRVNLLSAVSAAAAVGLVCLCAQLLLPRGRFRLPVSVSTGLVFAFSPLLWSQAVISEVYTLHALFAALLLYLLLRWRSGDGDNLLWFAGLVLGLGLGNHLTLVLMVPAVPVLLWPQRRRLCRVRLLVPTAILFAAGLGIYAYLPIAASRHPLVNWGSPTTWPRFLWVVTAEQYQQFAFGLANGMIPARLSRWAALLADQLGWWGLLLALLGAPRWWKCDRPFALFAMTWSLLVGVYAFFYDTNDSHIYLIPLVLLMALFWGKGTHYLLLQTSGLLSIWRKLVLAILLLLPIVSLAHHWRGADLSDDQSVTVYVNDVLDAVAPGGLVVVRGDQPTFSLWYALYAEDLRPDVTVVSGPLLAYIWYREELRLTYPHLAVPEPLTADVTWHDVVVDLIGRNMTSHPVYATDPSDSWAESYKFVQETDLPLYRVRPK